jgi:hypothetical protein
MHMMTTERYDDVSLGTTATELKERFGTPYLIHQKKDGVVEYEYLERVSVANQFTFLRHYYFDIQDGKVTSKRMKTDKEVPLDNRNSYDLQTSKNGISF